MPLYVLEVSNVKTLSNAQIDLLRCGDYLVKKDASGEHAYKVTFKSDTGLCLTYHDASVIETQSYDKIDGVWTYNSEDKSELPVNGNAPYFEEITDKDGHARFIEGDIQEGGLPEGVSKLYGKWTLSGSHLLIVISYSLTNAVELSAFSDFGRLVNLPSWIFDKITPLFANSIVLQEVVNAFDNTANVQQLNMRMYKNIDSSTITLTNISTLTLSSTKSFRWQIDLLIDNE